MVTRVADWLEVTVLEGPHGPSQPTRGMIKTSSIVAIEDRAHQGKSALDWGATVLLTMREARASYGEGVQGEPVAQENVVYWLRESYEEMLQAIGLDHPARVKQTPA